jgi:hypothetical protein
VKKVLAETIPSSAFTANSGLRRRSVGIIDCWLWLLLVSWLAGPVALLDRTLAVLCGEDGEGRRQVCRYCL